MRVLRRLVEARPSLVGVLSTSFDLVSVLHFDEQFLFPGSLLPLYAAHLQIAEKPLCRHDSCDKAVTQIAAEVLTLCMVDGTYFAYTAATYS